jgi:hypothetical protein
MPGEKRRHFVGFAELGMLRSTTCSAVAISHTSLISATVLSLIWDC